MSNIDQYLQKGKKYDSLESAFIGHALQSNIIPKPFFIRRINNDKEFIAANSSIGNDNCISVS